MKSEVRFVDWLLLVLLTLLAAVFRIYELNASLWYDEVLTLVRFVRLPLQDILTTYTSLNNHVFFSLQAHESIALFGESAWSLRLPAMLFGVATIPAVWWLIRLIGAPLSWAHVSVGILALNYHHIWFSQNARGYTGLVFWCVLATVFFVVGQRKNRLLAWIGFGLASALAMYTHLSAAFYIAALGILYVLSGIAKLRLHDRATPSGITSSGIFGFLLAGLLTLLVHAPLLPQMLDSFAAVSAPATPTGDAVPEWRSPLWTLLEILRSLPLPLPATLVAFPLVLAVLGLGFVRIWRLSPIFATLFPTHVMITLILLIAAGMRIWPRYFLLDLVFLILFAVAGTAALAGWVAKNLCWGSKPLTYLGWAFGILASAVWATKNYSAPKQDFAGAIQLVNAQADANDARVSFGLASLPISTYFAPDWSVVQTQDELENLTKTRTVWLVYAFEDHSFANHPEIGHFIDASFTTIERLPGTLGGGTVIVLKSGKPQ